MKKLSLFAVFTFVLLSLLIACSNQKTGTEDNNKEGTSESEVTQNFPEKDIKFIVPYATGGASDLQARKFAEIIQEQDVFSGVDISVVNMEGGNTQNGLNKVLNAEPDGYTLLLHHTAFNTMEALNQIPMSYSDYETIGQVSELPFVFTGRKEGKSSFKEYQKAAKENPGTVEFGIPGVGGTAQMVMEYFFSETDSANNYKVVPYQGGGGELAPAILSGEVDIAAQTASKALGYKKSGDVIPLLASTQETLEEYPDTPTFKDFGVDKAGTLRYGFFAPPETPDKILNLWQEAIEEATKSSEFKKFAKDNVLTPKFQPGDDFKETLDSDQEMYDSIAGDVKEQLKENE